MSTKAIPVYALKGGVGKSTVCANLGLALKEKGFRIGFLDVDCTGSNLPLALGIPKPFPRVDLDTKNERMLPLTANGYEIFSLSFRFGEAALMWEGGEQKILAFGQEYLMRGTGRYALVRHMLSNVQFSSELDYLLLDLPPQSGDEVLSLFENIKNLYGIILVSQPTGLSLEDLERALNMIEVKKLPLLGMVGNMAEAVCPHCGHAYSPFLDSGADLEAFCQKHKIPYLVSIPLTPDRKTIELRFQELTEKMLGLKPVKTWEKSFKEKLETTLVKGLVKGLFAKDERIT